MLSGVYHESSKDFSIKKAFLDLVMTLQAKPRSAESPGAPRLFNADLLPTGAKSAPSPLFEVLSLLAIEVQQLRTWNKTWPSASIDGPPCHACGKPCRWTPHKQSAPHGEPNFAAS